MENKAEYETFQGVTIKKVIKTNEELIKLMAEFAEKATGIESKNPEDLRQNFLKSINILSEKNNLDLLLFYKEDIPISSVGITYSFDLKLGDFAYIYSVFVQTDQRRKGYFKFTMAYTCSKAILNNCHGVMFHTSETNEIAIKAYKSLGCKKRREAFTRFFLEWDKTGGLDEKSTLELNRNLENWIKEKIDCKIVKGELNFGNVRVLNGFEIENKSRVFEFMYNEDLTRYVNLFDRKEKISFKNIQELVNSQTNPLFRGYVFFRLIILESNNNEVVGFSITNEVNHPHQSHYSRCSYLFLKEDYLDFQNNFLKFAIMDLTRYCVNCKSTSIFLEISEEVKTEDKELMKIFEDTEYRKFLDLYSWDFEEEKPQSLVFDMLRGEK